VLSARLMKLLVTGTGTIAIVKYLPEDDMVETKIDGFRTHMQENSNLRLITYGVREIKGFREYDKVAKQILVENSDLKGIFVAYPSAYKIAKYIKSKHPEKKISIIGYSRIPENIELLKQGAIDFLISQMPKRQGYEGVYALYNYIVLKEKVEPQKLMQIDIITKENVDYILE